MEVGGRIQVVVYNAGLVLALGPAFGNRAVARGHMARVDGGCVVAHEGLGLPTCPACRASNVARRRGGRALRRKRVSGSQSGSKSSAGEPSERSWV